MTLQRFHKGLIGAVLASTFLPIAPLQAQSVDEMQRQLEAQQQINAQLRRRVLTLEKTVERLEAENGAPDGSAETQSASEQEQRVALPAPADDALDEGELGALEQALVQRGSSVLPPGTAQIIPSASWSHSGSSALGSESNTYISSLSARLGLRRGAMLSVAVPYVVHAENGNGDNSGFGDLSVSITKQLLAQNQNLPSLLASLGYVAPTGEDFFETAVPLGAGFHSIEGTLSSVKSAAPVAFYGDLSYSHPFSRNVSGSKFQPGDAFGFGFGSTLAATPEIALSASMNFDFVGKFETDGITIDGSDRTIGTLGLAAGFLLSRSVYLSISGQFGVTEDASDLALGVTLPMRF